MFSRLDMLELREREKELSNLSVVTDASVSWYDHIITFVHLNKQLFLKALYKKY